MTPPLKRNTRLSVRYILSTLQESKICLDTSIGD
jgi:hypothetical protein